MASFESHIGQAKNNLLFLSKINNTNNEFWDWQVTTCFYIAVHLVNAHIAKKGNLHYHTHEAVKNLINPFNTVIPIFTISSDCYLDYTKLEGLSRRSRYLCNDKKSDIDKESTHITYDKHFAKAIKCLDRIVIYFNKTHKIEFKVYDINCVELKKVPLTYFKIVN